MIYYVDASAFAKSACLKQLYRQVVDGYTKKRKDISIEYGVAFHKCCQVFEETFGDEQRSIVAAQDHLKSVIDELEIPKSKAHLNLSHLTVTCVRYFQHRAAKENFKVVCKDVHPIVEQKFAIPFYMHEGIEFMLSGTIDRVVQMNQSGLYVLRDYKTTSVWNIKDYLAGYRLSGQMRIYLYAIRWYARNYPNSVFAEIYNKRIGVAIDGVFLKVEPTETTFASSDVMYYTDDDIDEIDTLMHNRCVDLATEIAANRVPMRYGILAGYCDGQKFGQCPFYAACAAPDTVAENAILKQHFNQKQYNPLKFHD